jgi:hypothetical protein
VIVPVLTFATITIPAGETMQLVTSESGPTIGPGPVYYNVLNLGPDVVYLRQGQDPAPGDPHSETLPALAADNMIFVPDATEGLRILAGPAGASVSVRVAVPLSA